MEHFQPRHCMSDTFRGFSFIHDDFCLPERKENEVENYWNSIDEDGESASECASSKYEHDMTITNASVSVAATMESDKKKRPPRKRKKKKEGEEMMLSPTESPGPSENGTALTPAPSEKEAIRSTALPNFSMEELVEVFKASSREISIPGPSSNLDTPQPMASTPTTPLSAAKPPVANVVAATVKVPLKQAEKLTPSKKLAPAQDWQVTSAKKVVKGRIDPLQLRNERAPAQAKPHARQGPNASGMQARVCPSKPLGAAQSLPQVLQSTPATNSAMLGSWATKIQQKPTITHQPPRAGSVGVETRFDSAVRGKDIAPRGFGANAQRGPDEQDEMLMSPSTDWRHHNMSPATIKAVVTATAWPSLADFPPAGDSSSQPKVSSLQGAWASKKR